MYLKCFKKNNHVLCFLVFFVFGLSFYTNISYFLSHDSKYLRFFPPFIEGVNQTFNGHLGAEYYFIAESLAAGKGFSNPFQVDTGPTAWMPPFYPFFLALLIKLFRLKMLVACFIVFIKNLVLVATGVLIYEIGGKPPIKIRAEFTVVLYCLMLLTYFRWFFQLTHDEWLLLLLICIMFPFSVFIYENHINYKHALAWGGVGGFSILTSPVLGFVWFLTSLFVVGEKKNFKPVMLSLCVFIVACSPWFIRNYLVFNKLILMKSNLYFELYATNYETAHGLFDEPTFARQHPIWTTKNDPDSPYKKYGEVQFMCKS